MSEASQNKRMVTPEQLDNMRHMLGITGNAKKGQGGYRNHYAAGHGDVKTLESMAQLVSMGLVSEGSSTATMQYFHCTLEGCKFAGLSKAEIRRVGYSV